MPKEDGERKSSSGICEIQCIGMANGKEGKGVECQERASAFTDHTQLQPTEKRGQTREKVSKNWWQWTSTRLVIGMVKIRIYFEVIWFIS